MGLRSQLDDLLLLQEATGQFANSAQNLRQGTAGQLLAQQGGGLAQHGQLGDLASLAFAAGDTSLLRELMQKQAAQGAGAASPELVQAYQSALGGGLKLPAKVTPDQLGKLADISQRRQQMSMGETAEARRAQKQQFDMGTKFISQKAKDFSSPLVKTEKEINDSTASLDSSLRAFNEKATPAAGNLLIRAIIKASGDSRVSDQDIAGLELKGLPNKATDLLNFLQGTQFENLTDAQKTELQRIAKAAIETKDTRIKRVLGDQFSSQLAANPELLNLKGGKAHPSVKRFADKLNIDVRTDEDGNPVFEKVSAPITVDGGKASFMNTLNPEERAAVDEFISVQQKQGLIPDMEKIELIIKQSRGQ